jgi:hypothetical protein
MRKIIVPFPFFFLALFPEWAIVYLVSIRASAFMLVSFISKPCKRSSIPHTSSAMDFQFLS